MPTLNNELRQRPDGTWGFCHIEGNRFTQYPIVGTCDTEEKAHALWLMLNSGTKVQTAPELTTPDRLQFTVDRAKKQPKYLPRKSRP